MFLLDPKGQKAIQGERTRHKESDKTSKDPETINPEIHRVSLLDRIQRTYKSIVRDKNSRTLIFQSYSSKFLIIKIPHFQTFKNHVKENNKS